MASWLECCYGSQPPPPPLPGKLYTMLSCCGVQQGDPLGPLGFALALHPIIEKVIRSVPGLLINTWYLDDGTLCGSATDLLMMGPSVVQPLTSALPSKLLRLKALSVGYL